MARRPTSKRSNVRGEGSTHLTVGHFPVRKLSKDEALAPKYGTFLMQYIITRGKQVIPKDRMIRNTSLFELKQGKILAIKQGK